MRGPANMQPGCISLSCCIVPPSSTDPYLFGDLLALARRSWIRQLAGRLQAAGFPGYRRSDSAVLRLLHRGPLPVGRLGEALAISRQAARKVADSLEQRGYARAERDESDSRRLNIVLTPLGEAYAGAIVAVIRELNAELAGRVDASQLAAADVVLRAVFATGAERQYARRAVRPPQGR